MRSEGISSQFSISSLLVWLMVMMCVLLRPLPIVPMFNWDAVLHFFLTGGGLFVLLRRWQIRPLAAFIGSIAFMFSGVVLPRFMIGHVSIVHAIAWIGWLLWAYDRLLFNRQWPDLLLTVWFTLLVMLGGHPQMSVLVLLLPVCYFVFIFLPAQLWPEFGPRKWKTAVWGLTNSVLVGLLAVGLLFVQLLPLVEWLNLTSRGQQTTFDSLTSMTDYSLNIEYLLTLLAPLAFYAPTAQETIHFTGFSHYWEASPFITVSGLFLLALGVGAKHHPHRRLVWFLAGITAVGLLMSMGKQNPVWLLFHTYAPIFRGPGRFLLWWGFGLSALLAFSANSLPDRWPQLHHRLRGLMITAVFLFLSGFILWVWFNQWGQSWLMRLEAQTIITPVEALIAGVSIPRSSLLLLISGAGLLLLFRLGAKQLVPVRYWLWVAAGMILLEGLIVARVIVRPFPVTDLRRDDHPLALLEIDPGEVRVPAYREPPNYLTPTLVHVRNGEEFYAVERLDEAGERGWHLMSAGFWPISEPTIDTKFELRQQTDGAYLYEHIHNIPRLYAATAVFPVRSDEDAFQYVMNEGFRYEEQAVITLTADQTVPDLPTVRGETAVYSVEYIDYANNSLSLRLTTDRPVLLVLGEVEFPGWQATLNGEPAPIYRANYAFRGIVVPAAGTHQIDMIYRPRSFQIGLGVSGLTAVLLLLLTGWQFKQELATHTDRKNGSKSK